MRHQRIVQPDALDRAFIPREKDPCRPQPWQCTRSSDASRSLLARDSLSRRAIQRGNCPILADTQKPRIFGKNCDYL
jgi:hypothetical protein